MATTTETLDPDQLETEAEVQAALHEAQEAFRQASSRVDEAAREARGLRGEAQRLRREPEEALLPGRDPEKVAEKREREAGEKERRAEALTQEKRRARDRRDALQRRLAELKRDAIRSKEVPRLAERRRREVEEAARLGREVLGLFRHYHQARAKRLEAEKELRKALAGAGVTSGQKREVNRYLSDREGEAAAEALVGLLVARVVDWARHVSRGPVPELFNEAGIEALDGSPRHSHPFQALEATVAELEQGRLPDSPKLT